VSDPIVDLKQELVAAAEREHAHIVAPPDGPWRALLSRGRLLVAAATLVIAAAATLFFTAPWSSSPSFLERAQAALAQDAGVLHATWEITSTSTDRACTVTRGPEEIWIDEAPPYRYRAILHGFPPDSGCSNGAATEIGGTFDPLRTLVFEPPITLRVSQLLFNMPPDPARVFREALERGAARDEGETTLDGRTVHRIWVDPCPEAEQCGREPGYVYLDPQTFYPVEIRGPGYLGTAKVANLVFHYRTFEYLPRTAANLALSDIQAQHPNAVAVAPSYGG
jgi:hypothetical protein